jgi:hypothetical protein
MLISTGMLSEIILTERRLEETPARQERRRITRLAAEIAQCVAGSATSTGCSPRSIGTRSRARPDSDDRPTSLRGS